MIRFDENVEKTGVSTAKIQSETELASLIERARTLFEQGDIEAAYKISAVSYDQAKAIAASAERVKASRSLIAKAREMQAHALIIECKCQVGLLGIIETGMVSGEIASKGRPRRGSECVTLKELGVSRARLHEARALREAYRIDPDIFERLVNHRLSQGLEPSRAYVHRNTRKAATSNFECRTSNFRLVEGSRLTAISWSRLQSLIRVLRRDLILLEKIENFCVPPDVEMSVSEILGPDTLKLLINEHVHPRMKKAEDF